MKTTAVNAPSEKHHRRSIRLKDYDYSQVGAYFVTVCVKDLQSVLGSIENGEVKLSTFGKIVKRSWSWLAEHHDYVDIDEFVVMPNHIHGILILNDTGRGGSRTAPTTRRKPLGQLVGAFKTVSTKQVNRTRGTPGAVFWQRNYYEHIVRTETSLNHVREYVYENPLKWELDRENPDRIGVNRAEELWFGKAVPRR
jgi:REP element-mobilizing transposase RayT